MKVGFNIMFLIACLVFQTGYIFCQKYDYNYFYRPSTSLGGVSVEYSDSIEGLTFEQFNWDGTISGSPILSDANGSLLGYFNSRNIYNSIDSIAMNGDSMAVGYYLNYFFQSASPNLGFGNGGNCAFIPINDSLYYLFYGTAELWVGAPNYAINFEENGVKLSSYSEGVFLTKVRVSKNRNLYILPHEKKIHIKDDLIQYANLIFCKHANGTDWWLVAPKALDGKAYRFLIKNNGDINELDEITFTENYWRVRTSADFDVSSTGRLFARLIHRTDTVFSDILELLQFDRCEGSFNLLNTIEVDIPKYFTHWGDVKFSDNERFLYVALGSIILQFDLEESLTLNSWDTIGVYDNFRYNNNRPLFDQMWLLPNNTILVTGNEFTPYIHYILEPNEKGQLCNFYQRKDSLPVDNLNPPFRLKLGRLPNFPPFRMNALEIECEANLGSNSLNSTIVVKPTLTSDFIEIEGVLGPVILNIFDVSGNVLLRKSCTIENTERISLTSFMEGIYFILLTNSNGKIIHREKIIKHTK